MAETPKEQDYVPRTTSIVDQYGLNEKQADTLCKELNSDSANNRISSFSNLHDFVSRNFAKQLPSRCERQLATADDVKGVDLADGWEEDFTKVVLDSEIDLPGGITLLPGEFIQRKTTGPFVKGTLEIRNQKGKSIGIRFSRCSGNDYPQFFMREAPGDSVTAVDWDHDDGPRMNTISDMWLRPQPGRELSNVETVVLGLMQAQNKERAAAKQLSEENVKSTIEDIRGKLTL